MKKVVLFGVGSGLKDVLAILPPSVSVVSLSDNDATKHNTRYLDHDVVPPSALKDLQFDYIIITSRFGEEIKPQLIGLGILPAKILSFNSVSNSKLINEANFDITILNKELGFSIPEIRLSTMYLWPAANNNTGFFQADFVRYMAVNLVAERMNKHKVRGNVAELGVYKGDLSVFLANLFPDKKLHLFDTFEGFDKKDVAVESQNSFSVSASSDFSDTSLQQVMERMPKDGRVIPHKGYFPESAAGVEDQFCFVSIDVDLYAPTIAGLNYFFPRLVPGGYIFVHDYNNVRYLGVRKAVEEFLEKEKAACLTLPDFAGSIVIFK